MNDGGPAFPRPTSIRTDADGDTVELWEGQCGMGIRDYFAAAALTGLCANRGTTMVFGAGQTEAVNMTTAAFACADAMIQARQPKP
jgi:hypothetical protein